MRIKSCSEMEGEGDGMKTGDMDRGKYDCLPTHIKGLFEIHGHEIKVGQVIMVVCFSLTLFRYMLEDIE